MIRRCGNFGILDDASGNLYSFSLGNKGFVPSSFLYRGASGWAGSQYISVAGNNIIPYGSDNDLPGRVCRLLENFYAGEGILGKKVGLQWGEGPRLYKDAVDGNNTFYRQWVTDAGIIAELEASDYLTQMQRCMVDMCHLEGFWVKFTRNRGARLGAGKLLRVEHVPVSKVRFVWPGIGKQPTHAMIADFPNVDSRNVQVLPLFDSAHPFRSPESLAYYSAYSYNREHYSVPRFIGAFDWLELAGTLAPMLAAYNVNAAAISKHIESPQSYWDAAEARIKADCELRNEPYSEKLLDDFKDTAMEQFAASLTGRENVGKFLHTSSYFNAEARNFEGWKITPIDNKLKEYIDAQLALAKKAEAAATSGFGLDPSLSNLILDTKLGSGSEKLYALKVYNATETAIPDMVLCKPFQQFIEANHPGTAIRIGLYRTIVDAEKDVSPQNRVKANA